MNRKKFLSLTSIFAFGFVSCKDQVSIEPTTSMSILEAIKEKYINVQTARKRIAAGQTNGIVLTRAGSFVADQQRDRHLLVVLVDEAGTCFLPDKGLQEAMLPTGYSVEIHYMCQWTKEFTILHV